MKTWLITDASRGFGALIAKRALEVGENVVATARNPQTIVDAPRRSTEPAGPAARRNERAASPRSGGRGSQAIRPNRRPGADGVARPTARRHRRVGKPLSSRGANDIARCALLLKAMAAVTSRPSGETKMRADVKKYPSRQMRLFKQGVYFENRYSQSSSSRSPESNVHVGQEIAVARS